MSRLRHLSLSLLSLGLPALSPLCAQVYTPPPASQGAPPSPAPQPAPAQGNDNSEPKPFFGNEIPLLDPTTENISFAGKTWPLADTRLVAARYEKYLNEPEDNSEDSKRYRKIIKNIIETVSPLQQEAPVDKLRKALRMLPKAAEFQGDSDLCRTLENTIHTAYISKSDISSKKKAISELEKEKKQTVYNMGMVEKSRSISGTAGRDLKEKEQSKPTTPITAEYVNMTKRLLEIEALKKKYEGEGALSSVQSKILYQSQLVNFTLQRRFEHAKIGCCVYNIIFNDGDNKLKLEKGSDASKLFGETVGMPPTISTIESLSNEAIGDSYRSIQAVQNLIKTNRLTAANKRLSEAFYIGEYLEPVRTFPFEDKQRLLSYIDNMRALKGAMEGRDFTTAKEYVEKLKKQSDDFNPSIVSPLIETAMQASNLHLMNAQQAMLTKNDERAQSEIKQAMSIWPLNPKLNDLYTSAANAADIVVAKKDFERLLREENYRQIFRDQYRFAPSIAGDARLEDAFKQIITNITKIETAMGKAEEFAKMGQPYAAWEELRLMHDQKVFSKDPELGNAIVRLSPKVSELAVALETAQSLEGRGEIGSALAWYLKARNVYPGSKYAREGIDRLMGKIFPENA